MNVLDSKIYHNKQYANPPTLQILVDGYPATKDMVFQSKPLNGGTAYFAEKNGYVSFFHHDPRLETGYGGSIFTLTLETGETVNIKGPWSSRPSVMGPLFGIDCMDASLILDRDSFNRGFTFSAGHITIELAKTIILPSNYHLILNPKHEPTWEIAEIE
jgi:hypothetical protein